MPKAAKTRPSSATLHPRPPRPSNAPRRLSDRADEPASDWGRVALVAAGLIALIFIAYWPSLTGGYLWDDNKYVSENPNLRTLAGLWTIWFEPLRNEHYYPLAISSFWVEYQLWGLSTTGHHIVNTLLHAITAILVWVSLRRLAVPGALLAAFVFALHPVHVESVAWISERKNVLCGVFYLLSLLAWVRFGESRQWRDYAVAALLFSAAMLSKTIACTLPITFLIVEWWKRPADWWRRGPHVAPLLTFAVALGLLTVWREHQSGTAEAAVAHLSFVERFLIAGRAFWFYPWKLLWPVELMTIYPKWVIDPTSVGQWLFPLAAAAAVGVPWALRDRLGRGPAAALLHYSVTIAPSLGLIAFTSLMIFFVSDHYQYLSSISLIALACALATQWLARLAPAPVRITAAVILVGVLGVLTFAQATIYQNKETLWRDSVTKNPEAWLGQYDLGTYLGELGRDQESLVYLSGAVRLQPAYAPAQHNLGMLLARNGSLPEAVVHLREATRLNPGWAQAHSNLCALYIQGNQLAEAIGECEEAIRLQPSYAEARLNLAVALRRSGRPQEAIPHLQQVLQLQPDNRLAQDNLRRAIDAAPKPSP